MAKDSPAKPPKESAAKSANRVWQVSIDTCLLGVRFVAAASETEAIDKYKRPCGITSHAGQARATPTDIDPAKLPPGVELFGD